jgi:glycosyltransferase involved in cell wall biosynthesis
VISVIYSATTSGTVQQRLGVADYSYYFVLKEFSPVLETFGPVIVVADPAEVDPIYRASRARGEECIFFSFTPPHEITLGLDCPTIPIVAWEIDEIPTETWYGERKQDWRYVFDKVGRAITLSTDSAQVVRAAMGADFPVVSIPAPVWDRFASKPARQSGPVVPAGTQLDIGGTVIDSRTIDLSTFAPDKTPPVFPYGSASQTRISLDGVTYLSVFNPADGRKNWRDFIAGFCCSFRDTPDATLILKLAHHGSEEFLTPILEWLYKLTPFRCRLLMLLGFLEEEQYERLVGLTSYVVNSSHGEGQCLPLMEGMARGKPAIAPSHTAMSDYIDTPQAFVVRSSAEPATWPQDVRAAFRALRQRIDLGSLVEAYRQSYAVAKNDPARYARMSENAREAMRQQASIAVARARLEALIKTPARPAGPDGRYGQVTPRPHSPRTANAAEASKVL